MSDQRNKQSSGVEGTHHPIVVQTSPSPHALIKANRVLLSIVSVLLVVVFFLGYALLPSYDVLDDYQSAHPTEAYRNQMNPVLSKEISVN